MPDLALHFYNDSKDTTAHFSELAAMDLPARLKALAWRVERKGIESLDPAKNRLIHVTMELDPSGRKVANDRLGVFQLSWLAGLHPEWSEEIALELDALRAGLKKVHSAPLRFVIWAGMGGSAEDKNMYQALGMFKKGPKYYALDSTDPAKLKYILEDIRRRSKLDLASALKRTLVVGMALGMTSYEPVVNLEQLALLYDKLGVDSRPNFIYMTLPGSLLDQFARKRGYRRIELQMDGRYTTAGRHSSPLTRGSLYPLGLCGVDLAAWTAAANLGDADIGAALRLSAFLHAQIEAGRDKITLVLPKAYEGAALWTKQEFEESLGKSEAWGIKIIIGEKVRLPHYRSRKEHGQDRAFLCIQEQGTLDGEREKAAALRRAGYPVAVLTLPRRTVLSRYMQFIHYSVFGLASLRDMNFVTQPGVELYKAIANRIHTEARRLGGIQKTAAWREVLGTERRSKWRGRVTLHHWRIDAGDRTAPQVYAAMIRDAMARRAEYAELTFFGDTRYSAGGRALRSTMGHAAEALFLSRLKMPVDIYEGPAMNHSYHEMIIGHGRCFSTILLAEQVEKPKELDYPADYHQAQFLATIQALEQRGRAVAAVTLRDLEPATLDALEEFYRQTARLL